MLLDISLTIIDFGVLVTRLTPRITLDKFQADLSGSLAEFLVQILETVRPAIGAALRLASSFG